MYPSISDGIVLTGFSMNASFVGYFAAGADFVQANLNQPFRFGNISSSAVSSVLSLYGLADFTAGLNATQGLGYPNGYLTNSNINSQQFLFFLPKHFDTGILELGEATKQPVTVGEILTLGSVPMMNEYAGPVLIITGCKIFPFARMQENLLMPNIANDLPYCGGDCLATGDASLPSIPGAAAKNFPKVAPSNFTAYIQPNTGHGINFHYNATGAYDVVQNFLVSKGIMST